MPHIVISRGAPYATGTVTTTDATVTNVMTLAVPTGTTWQLRVNVAARRTSDGAAAGYTIVACVKNVAGTVTVVGLTNVAVNEDVGIAATWNCDLLASGGTVLNRVQGGVADTVVWSATAVLEAAA